MNFRNIKTIRTIVLASLATAGLALTAGCSNNGHANKPAAKKAAKPAAIRPLAIKDPAKNETGAQIWSQNCMRCHQLRSPSQYTPAQWGVIVQYMRLKAGLTGEQARKVLAFLKSASAH
ncbi:MAG: hypothetical protein HKL95_07940 [Phycisphaerae bacterium]|nr:hypothetical protein [Phycisphaerae bacterium]